MPNYWKLVNKVIRESDILLIVLDARMAEESRNTEIEDKINKAGKKLLYVINKSDLLGRKELAELKLNPRVVMSARERQGSIKLLRKLSRMAAGRNITAGVLGYPNTGKSSVINALRSRQSAPKSSISGYTRSLQKVRVSKNIMLLDTPGVFPHMEKDDTKHAVLGAKDPSLIKDPEGVVMDIMGQYLGKIERYYRVKTADPEQVLEAIAIKNNMVKKGGVPDTERAARRILYLLQKGKIR